MRAHTRNATQLSSNMALSQHVCTTLMMLLKKKCAGLFTSSVLDMLSALLTYIPWTTNHTHSAQHSALANKFQKLINATNEKMLNNYK